MLCFLEILEFFFKQKILRDCEYSCFFREYWTLVVKVDHKNLLLFLWSDSWERIDMKTYKPSYKQHTFQFPFRPLGGYNSLLDKNLSGYFANTRMRRHLIKSGLVCISFFLSVWSKYTACYWTALMTMILGNNCRKV